LGWGLWAEGSTLDVTALREDMRLQGRLFGVRR
jgi:hypothetical protein